MRSMRRTMRTAAATTALGAALMTALITALITALGIGPAAAATDDDHARVVFVQNDDPAGNVVYAYRRHHDGTLTLAGSYPTGGLGGILGGSVVDHLASQGALALDAADGLLFAVNAGSDTVSVFGVRGDRLDLRQTIRSRGDFPVSVAMHRHLLYVLNARDGGSVAGFRIADGRLRPIRHSTRPLGLDPTATPEFTNTPGQVLFTPDGRHLLVTTKANGNAVEVFTVRDRGRLSGPVTTTLPGAVPFAGVFDRSGRLVLTEAGPNAVATFDLTRSGRLAPLDSQATGQTATCWITAVRHVMYASNAGSGSLTGLATEHDGDIDLRGQTATDPGTVDAAASGNGRYLYVQTGGAGVVDEFRVHSEGGLTLIGSVTVPHGVGGEGIAAS
jgi:DNA-binding beta-propeller fold protein YncE